MFAFATSALSFASSAIGLAGKLFNWFRDRALIQQGQAQQQQADLIAADTEDRNARTIEEADARLSDAQLDERLRGASGTGSR